VTQNSEHSRGHRVSGGSHWCSISSTSTIVIATTFPYTQNESDVMVFVLFILNQVIYSDSQDVGNGPVGINPSFTLTGLNLCDIRL
jgi:hypothetical protein